MGNDSLIGEAGDDTLAGGRDTLAGATDDTNVGGSDTLEGGTGTDTYIVDLEAGGGSRIIDAEGNDIALIFAGNTDFDALIDATVEIVNTNSLEPIANPNLYGDSAIALSTPQAGTVGIQKSNTDLIIDLNRDGVAEGENDLTIFDFFDETGELGVGAVEVINNIIDPQSIVDFFANSANENNPGSTVYRFFNSDSGVHFYTANEIEKDAVMELPNFSFEGASYLSADPLTGQPEPLPVYRFLNRDTGVHLYTISESERDAVEELSNYSFEGEAFLAHETEVAGSIRIYRFYNSTSGAHFYTPSANEKEYIEANLSDFQLEGIAYYAFPLTQ